MKEFIIGFMGIWVGIGLWFLWKRIIGSVSAGLEEIHK